MLLRRVSGRADSSNAAIEASKLPGEQLPAFEDAQRYGTFNAVFTTAEGNESAGGLGFVIDHLVE